MEILRHIEDRGLSVSGSVVTMGNFDGIHLGHQVLIRNAVAESTSSRVSSVVLTFEPHPLKILVPERAPRLILTHKDKMQLLRGFGVDIVIIQPFDRRFAAIEPVDFVRDFLVERLRVKKIWVGRDLRFGRARKGHVDDLIRWGGEFGFEVGVVEPILLNGIRVSSSCIRRMIEQGEVDKVEPALGRYHFISGNVVGGHRRGRDLGFPTANIASRTEVIPTDGIYATVLQVKGDSWLSVSSVGLNPTFGNGPRTIESFIFDFADDIYNEPVKLSFVRRIRDERKFTNVGDLVMQINEDVNDARGIFQELGMRGSTK
jgi:riboflavin kinase/FMN adenylyltransferase